MANNGTIEELLGAGAGWARMVGATAGDLAGALNPVNGNGHGPDDWLDAWDPEYIRTTLPTLRLFSDVYHRAEVRGLRNIPAEGPVLLVGNHSGGTLISDTFVFAQALLRPLRPAAALPPARPRHGVPDSGRARLAVSLRDRAGLPGEHGPRA